MATDVMQGLVSEAKSNRFSTIPKLSDTDVFRIWDAASGFIERYMSQQKGVSIPGLGLFTFSQRKLEVGNNKCILIQRPVFVLSEKFAMTHALQTNKYHTDGKVPIVPMNFAALSTEMTFNRDTVESCVKEVIQALSRSVQAKKNVEFIFTYIGRLFIRDSKVKMKFYREFLESMDGSGNLINALQNRPGTSDSILSGGRLLTSSTVVLPRINPGDELDRPGSPISSVTESARSATPAKCTTPGSSAISGRRSVISIPNNKKMMATINEEQQITEQGQSAQNEHLAQNEHYHEEIKQERLHSCPEKIYSPFASHRLEIQPVKMGVNFRPGADDWLKDRSPPRTPQKVPKSPGVISASGVEDRGKVRLLSPADSARQPPTTDIGLTSKAPAKKQIFDKTCSNCLHDAGQEMCYLCYQRDRRNIPVYLHEERRTKEQEEDRFLQQYQHFKDDEAIMQEQTNMLLAREQNQKYAAFNLGVAEAVKSKKNERPTEFHRSFIFYKRSVTPPFLLSQNQYHSELADQVRTKAKTHTKTRKDKNFLERLEQVQLAEDLAAQRQQYLRNKQLQSEEYRKALDTQLRYQPLRLPISAADSDGPIFGIHDVTHEKMVEKRIQARNLFDDQLNTAVEKKRHAMLNDLKTEKQESDMLNNARKDLLEEILERNREKVIRRKDLETTWFQDARGKRAKQKEETRRGQNPGALLHEQCDQYNRCRQCKRRVENCGESNVWCESRYVPGCRIMV